MRDDDLIERYLQQLAAEYDQRWQAYLEALAARGLRRSH